MVAQYNAYHALRGDSSPLTWERAGAPLPRSARDGGGGQALTESATRSGETRSRSTAAAAPAPPPAPARKRGRA